MVDQKIIIFKLEELRKKCKDFSSKIRKFKAPYSLALSNGKKADWVMSEWAFAQLLNKLHIPVNYVKTCPHPLQEKNVNYWLSKTNTKFFIRAKSDDFIRAVLSTKYSIIDNIEVFEIMRELTESLKIECSIVKYYLDWAKFVLNYAFDIEFDKDKSKIGILVINSEVGAHSVFLYPVIFIGKAMSRIIPDVQYRQRHIFTDIDIVRQTMKVKLGEIMELQPQIIETYLHSEHIDIDIDEVLEHIRLAYDIRKGEHTLITEEARGSRTLKQLVGAIAIAGEKLSDIERTFELQKIGGKMLTRYTPNGIVREEIQRTVEEN